MNSNLIKTYQRHGSHLVDPSPWPFVASMSALISAVGAAMYFHGFINGEYFLLFGFFLLNVTFYLWWRDVTREATYEGHHTSIVQNGLRYGVLLFIVSEVFFFVSFFWGFFHSSVSPNIEIGVLWPPKGISVFNPWEIPFLNTLILLLSGCTITWAHHAMVAGNRNHVLYSLVLTLILAIWFLSFQIFEYTEASFRLSDGIYGSTFYMATGGHGLHVMIGTIFIFVCFLRFIFYHLTQQHHFGFEASAWYWHFVDVVWLFLFVSMYWWGSN
uniref:cytochrome c oxidase subunit 3 n=1 Tax=Madagascaria erythrocladioides TaxID=753684 RepID=UPI001FCDE18A|nr:cytochrome c oxidase subunit 3 [Madagascaria erythrocladioides]UNJ18793.1 cytochrome c oxidase subunit 3 [Madagascaria erythrocladioides]